MHDVPCTTLWADACKLRYANVGRQGGRGRFLGDCITDSLNDTPAAVTAAVLHAGYIVQDARAFRIDTSAPESNIMAALAPVPGAPRSALFAFAAADAAPVAFSCRLSGTAWQAAPLPAAFAAVLGAWLPCQSPQARPGRPQHAGRSV
jgi:hypothetical protein